MRLFKTKFSFKYYFAWVIGGPIIGYDRYKDDPTIIIIIPFMIMEFSMKR